MTSAIRPARTDDLPAILDLLRVSGLPQEGLAEHLGTALVWCDGETPVGCIALEVYGRAALLRSAAVSPHRRGQGIGQHLTRAALDLAQRSGVETLYLLTETAAGYFSRFGFRPVPRSGVALEVQQSVEFTSACPQSAQAMALLLDPR